MCYVTDGLAFEKGAWMKVTYIGRCIHMLGARYI